MEIETLPRGGGETFCSGGNTIGFGASGDTFFTVDSFK